MMFRLFTCYSLLLFLAFTLMQCSSDENRSQEINSHEAFFQNLSSMCGRQLHGEGIFPNDPEHELIDVNLLLTIATCEEDEIRIPFHAGNDRSRTFVITMSEEGLHLRHDHRYEDGTPHDLTDYGGYANMDGDANRQFFAADDLTVEMLPEAATNVWMMEMDMEAGRFVYYLERHNEPRFRAEFAIAN